VVVVIQQQKAPPVAATTTVILDGAPNHLWCVDRGGGRHGSEMHVKQYAPKDVATSALRLGVVLLMLGLVRLLLLLLLVAVGRRCVSRRGVLLNGMALDHHRRAGVVPGGHVGSGSARVVIADAFFESCFC